MNDEIASLKKQIENLEKEIDILYGNKTIDETNIRLAKKESELADEIKNHFSDLYIVRKFGGRFGFEQEARELTGTDLDYEVLLKKKDEYSFITRGETKKTDSYKKAEEIFQAVKSPSASSYDPFEEDIIQILAVSERPLQAKEVAERITEKPSAIRVLGKLMELEKTGKVHAETAGGTVCFYI